ncbi:MAG: gamma-glutamylcyclotransferase [Deltaproteobacteria bacterium]|nr:gamma-glutamylcyclotransferase [Deltaproteobacteria bacterium]
MDNPEERLIVYGTLVPGGIYHFLLADLPGTWEKCVIKGRMGEYGGFKAFQYDAAGPEHPAWLLTSPALPEKFPELDAFEGDPYRRTLIPARAGRGGVLAYIYEGMEID